MILRGLEVETFGDWNRQRATPSPTTHTVTGPGQFDSFIIQFRLSSVDKPHEGMKRVHSKSKH